MKEDLNSNKILEIRLETEEGIIYEVPEKGSLGLLALGHIGLLAWRRKRAQVKKKLNIQ